MLSTLMFAFMLHLYCDEPKSQTTKAQTSGCNKPTMKNYSNGRAALRPAKNTVPKVPHEPKAQTTQTSGCNEPTMKNYSNGRAALRPAKNTVPKVPRSARAALK